MATQRKSAAHNLKIGNLKSGRLGKITDVPGVKVGHFTANAADGKTGVTVILPRAGNVFTNKCFASSYVLNGFGKTLGLMQVKEVGTIETPIALTSSANVGFVHDALVEYTINQCAEHGLEVQSLNPLVCECNDFEFNRNNTYEIGSEEVFAAIDSACEDFEEGDVGAGNGMVCFDLKGGVGSSSRILNFDGKSYTIGILAVANYGSLRSLRINEHEIGSEIYSEICSDAPAEKENCVVVLATDIPLSCRQLVRIIKRCSLGILRTGGFVSSNGSEIFVGFTTSACASTDDNDLVTFSILNENCMDLLFEAVSDATEEAIIRCMLCADNTVLPDGRLKRSLSEFI